MKAADPIEEDMKATGMRLWVPGSNTRIMDKARHKGRIKGMNTVAIDSPIHHK